MSLQAILGLCANCLVSGKFWLALVVAYAAYGRRWDGNERGALTTEVARTNQILSHCCTRSLAPQARVSICLLCKVEQSAKRIKHASLRLWLLHFSTALLFSALLRRTYPPGARRNPTFISSNSSRQRLVHSLNTPKSCIYKRAQ